jgi:AAA family ATP:ADP antiporter
LTPSETPSRRHEWAALAGAFLLFMLLFASMFMLRPVRDTFGIASGVDDLQWLFLGTFVATLIVVPLYGWLSRKVPRSLLMPACYLFSALMLMLFAVELRIDPDNSWVARAAFIWLAVTNLFVFSIAWSLMSDIFNADQGHRLFGRIAAGASIGGVIGPLLSRFLVEPIGHSGLLLLSAALLLATLPCVRYLLIWRAKWGEPVDPRPTSEAMGGGIWAGLTLIAGSPQLRRFALFILLMTAVSTFLYFQQQRLVATLIPGDEQRTQLFSSIDLAVQISTLLIQLLITGELAKRLGVASLLVVVPAIMVIAFLLFALMPTLPILIGVMILRRVGDYALTSPGREMVFTVMDAEKKYRAKNAIDTVVFRGGDSLSAFLHNGIAALGGAMAVALAGAGLAAIWGGVGLALGRRHDAEARTAAPAPAPA